MEIYLLYELVRGWEEALTNTKPNDIQSVKIKPVIKDTIESYGKGKIWGFIEFTLERDDAYTQFNIVDMHENYSTPKEYAKAKRLIIGYLIDYLQQFLKEDDIELIWDQVEELALNWYEKPT